jgi:integrase
MGVKVREKEKGSGVWWLFINYKGKRTSRQIGTQKAAEKAMEHAQARLKLGMWLPEDKPKNKPKKKLPTLKKYFEDIQKTHLAMSVDPFAAH